MTIVVGFDLHREQITFDLLSRVTGEVVVGRIAPANRETLAGWYASLEGEFIVAVEGTTGWRYVVEEGAAAGGRMLLAEAAQTRALRGPKRKAKNDRLDARHLRELADSGRVPESWIAPGFLLDLRGTVRQRHTLCDERGAMQQRIHALLFHAGCPVLPGGGLLSEASRSWVLARRELTASMRLQVSRYYAVIDLLDEVIAAIDQDLRRFARAHRACIALEGLYGVGFLTACALYAEIGDARRFPSSAKVVRYAGLDVTVFESAGHRAPGRLSRQGSPVLRWAAYEAALSATRPGSPDHAAYRALRERGVTHQEAVITIARRVLARAYHLLVAIGAGTLEEPATDERRSASSVA